MNETPNQAGGTGEQDSPDQIFETIDREVREAVKWFWATQDSQKEKQLQSDNSTRGRRANVLGGKQMDGFASLIEDILLRFGVPQTSIVHNYQATLPGYFRHEKEWDTAVVHKGSLLAAIEFKSIASSFGNNLNNRTEEALGSNTDLRQAYEQGVFAPSARPWLGYLMLMAKKEGSTRPVRVREPNFDVDPVFDEASYAQRGEILCLRMVRQQLVDGAVFMLSDPEGPEGHFIEPNEELWFERFARRLTYHVLGSMK
ncbi:MAG: PaeR7I family type II restriction endonuclease [Longimonas sp.]|uniref:PaeR7I family type II restriction endonuclease n=1 Tax=Longimonas sp. TaxID=2039626 RepID=UPI00335B0AEA